MALPELEEAILRGDALAPSEGPIDEVWRLRCAASRLHPAQLPVGAVPEGARREHALAGLEHLVRRARFAGDHAAMAERLEACRSRGADEGWLALQRAWLLWLRGEDAQVPAGVGAHDHETPIELACFSALAALEEGQREDALVSARRAFRMARTEQHGPLEMLSALVLARTRRWLGHDALALRIASSVEARAPAHVRPWASWERQLAAGEHSPETMQALAGKDAAGPSPMFGDLRALGALARGELPWNAFAEHEAPQGLGALLEAEDDGEGVRGHVLLDGTARRIAARLAPSDAVQPPLQLRVDAVLCRIAQAGAEGVAEASLFEDVYGFSNSGGRYDGTLTVTLHRARKRIADTAASLERDGERLRLRGRLCLPDPRTRVGPTTLLLRRIAQGGEASARDLAEAAGAPLRTVQRMLRTLAESGACELRGRGRARHYVLEDTTFSEPTRTARWRGARE
ncbi:MAG: hypothetical protein AAF411_20500 [Myxococcota bacterium]